MANQQQQQQQQQQASSSSTKTTSASAAAASTANGQQTVIQLSNINLASLGLGLSVNNSNNIVTNTNNNNNNNTSTLLDMVMCKLVHPAHLIVDPRLLECGHSACYNCIMSIKDSEKNIKCTYCNATHKLPLDTNKLIVNKSLQSFIKQNINSNKNSNNNSNLRLFDEHIFIHDDKFTCKSAIDNLEAHLNHIENDIKQKIDIMRYNLDRLSEQFTLNIQFIRRELQKIHTDSSVNDPLLNHYQFQTLFQTQPSATTTTSTTTATTSNSTSKSQATQQSQRSNNNNNNNNFLNSNNTSTLLNATNSVTSNSFKSPLVNDNLTFTTNQQQTQSNSNNTSSNNSSNNTNSTSAQTQANNFVNLIQNFSNSSSFEHDDLDELENDLNTTTTTTNSATNANTKPFSAANNQHHQSTKRHLNKEQAQFNKFVREEVTKRFGENFLLQHEVNQLESSIMDLIKNEAISSFLPKDTAPARAWTLAKVSLRSLKRDLRRKQNQLFKQQKQDCKQSLGLSHPYLNV